jgi:hypothetical protein
VHYFVGYIPFLDAIKVPATLETVTLRSPQMTVSCWMILKQHGVYISLAHEFEPQDLDAVLKMFPTGPFSLRKNFRNKLLGISSGQVPCELPENVKTMKHMKHLQHGFVPIAVLGIGLEITIKPV